MKSKVKVLSVDIGGESGRVVCVGFDGENLQLEELHRFPNVPAKANGTLYWDILRLWNEIKLGIEKGKILSPKSIGVDTWAVDFVLLDDQDNLLSNPVHQRDSRTDGMMEKVFNRIPKEEIYSQTGIQFMSINTLFQIMSLIDKKSSHLSIAKTFLTTPDLLNFWLTGKKVCEFTSATTTQMFNPAKNNWAIQLMEKLKIPHNIFPEVVNPGIVLGKYKGMEVIAVATHDTGSAVAAIPVQTKDFAYVSSGTWNLVGLEIDYPLINRDALNANITNEGGVYGTYRFLKNVIGLWILQECRRTWQLGGKYYSYNELIKQAESVTALRSFVQPNNPVFLYPGDHPKFIKDFCKMTSQYVPETPGEIVRCILDSLALAYKDFVFKLLKISGRKADVIHVVGGGSKNKLLNQLTANATGLHVVAGPAEATVIGNAVVQLIALGELANLQEARQIISNIRALKHFEPMEKEIWDEAYQRYKRLPDFDNKF